MKPFQASLFIVLIAYSSTTFAQLTDTIKPSFSIETRVTNYFQSGYELSIFRTTKNHFSFGLQIAGQEIRGNAKELVFTSSDIDNSI